jgi:hypothetical protein
MTDTAVAPAPPQTFAELKALIEAKQAESDAVRDRRDALWLQRKTAPRDREVYIDFLMAEDQLEVLFHELEALRPQLEPQRLREAATAAQTGHDAGIPEARALAEQFLEGVRLVATLGPRLIAAFGAQMDPLMVLRSPDGHQALAVEDGRTYALQFFSALYPNDPRAKTAFELLVETPLTDGHAQAALAHCPCLRPFSQTAITTYLTSIEGATHGDGHVA